MNNRIIKFRVWDKRYGMEYIKDLYWFEEQQVHEIDPEDTFYIFMQYIGLKDKNNIEIYEGDWCRAEFRNSQGIKVIQGKIIMDDYMWCMECPEDCGDDIYSINRPHNFEVIGNLYENPDLIQK